MRSKNGDVPTKINNISAATSHRLLKLVPKIKAWTQALYFMFRCTSILFA